MANFDQNDGQVSKSRRIAPAPFIPEDDNSPIQRSGSTPNSAKSGASGIKRASTACQSCKQIKRKCDERHPCSNCVKTKTECIYDAGRDGRRRAVRKRNVEELELKRDALDTILDALRDVDDDSAQRLLQLIRSNAPLDDIISYASARSQDLPEEQLASMAVAVDNRMSRKSVLSISALIDTPPIKVPAQPWTSGGIDDDLVSHLISVYFTWVQPGHLCLDRDLFVKHMIARDINSLCCSPLLVNSILALACQFSDQAGAYSIPGDHTTRGKHFLEDALRLWNDSKGQPSLTFLQAGQILAIATTLIGKDGLSTRYIDHMNTIVDDVVTELQANFASSPEIHKLTSLVVWSLHDLSASYSLIFLRARTYRPPDIERVEPEDELYRGESKWFPYPDGEPILSTDVGGVTDMMHDLHEIGATIASQLFDVNGHDQVSWKDIQELEGRLQTLADRLPSPYEGGLINPILMDLNLIYHWLRITLFNFFKSTDSLEVSGWREDNLPQHARQQCMLSTQAVVEFFTDYMRDFGMKSFTLWMPQVATTAAYMLMEDLEDPFVQDLFHEVCLVLTSAARKWFLMRGHARMLFITAERTGKIIQPRTRQLLIQIALQSWGPDHHKFFESSSFPNYALARGRDPKSAAMGELLKKWADFQIDNKDVEVSQVTPATELDRTRRLFAEGMDSSTTNKS